MGSNSIIPVLAFRLADRFEDLAFMDLSQEETVKVYELLFQFHQDLELLTRDRRLRTKRKLAEK